MAAVVMACGLAMSVGSVASGQVQPHAGMLRWPDVSATQIVFSYANDVWVVSKGGGVASPLASPPGPEQFPRFSPDGKRVAFVGNYDGGRDLYTIGVEGGVPTRVTYHPGGEMLCDWTPDGKGLHYLTNGLAGLGRQTQAFTMSAEGGPGTKLPVPYSGFGAISPNGEWLAYTPHSTDTRTWKRYRGGMATDVWLFNLKDNSAKKVTDWEGTDTLPMWVPGGDGKVLYYLCDMGPEHRLNIWSYDVGSGARAQVTAFKDDDVRWPSVGPGGDGKGEIVFQLGEKLMLLNVGTGVSAEVKVTIPGAKPKLRTRTVDAAGWLSGGSISPSGKRVAMEARGELFSVPAMEGITRNLTRTDGVAERDPAWSPDGKWIAYFSDESGEYELWVRASDAKAPEEKKDEKKGERAEEKKEGEAKAEEKKEEKKADEEPKRETRKLTTLGAGFRMSPQWSPDSTMITFTDSGGRLMLTQLATGETKEVDKDPWMGGMSVSWSQDSKWMAYRRSDEKTSAGVIWIMEAKTGEKHRVTSGMFDAKSPAFDRKGDWLFYASSLATNNPEYSDLDTTYAYTNSEVLVATPLRKDVKSPLLPKSDEETWKKEEKKKDDKKKDEKKPEEGKKDDAKPEEKKPEERKEEKKEEKPAVAAKADDGVSGKWEGKVKGSMPQMAAGLPITVSIRVSEDGKVTGTISSMMGGGSVTGTYTKGTGEIEMSVSVMKMTVVLKGTVKDLEASGTWSAGDQSGDWSMKRTSADAGEEKKDDASSGSGGEKAKEVKIDFDGLEQRGVELMVGPGGFGQLAVTDGDKLLFVRRSGRSSEAGGIKIYDYKADEPKEEMVTVGGGFDMTPDGKKLLVGTKIVDASSGGGKAQSVTTQGMMMTIDPRDEWKQIFTDAWRIFRDYFYEPTMHGTDWEGLRKHYGAMLDDASSREDVNWIISEMISELNIGHAYLGAPGDVEGQSGGPSIGLLGADFALEGTGEAKAYRITRILNAGAWDADARGPLQVAGVDVKEGDYLLAVNGIEVDTTRDVYASFVGTAGKVTAITVNASPTMDGKQREVLVKPIGNETELRYRAYIESKRKYVEEKSGGKIGYIYVPNTGVDGQNDLYRQYFGQRGKDALIIDERWNGGGQIPTRFIELLNRPPTNYWARRDGNDWPWPPDAYFGHKCMLVNGLAGSGGDMFPWLFKQSKLGPVIGMRTWGGLVGISGNPGLIDGGSISVPTFGFYETDGTWGVEGHGTDPTIEVIDDPSKMVGGGDPQLDRGIEEMLAAIKAKPYMPPKRPASPTYRKGMGIEEKDK